ncbi:MAG: hypothetical protein RJA53_1443 [Bacteroidota bacterium]|jgi:uncharacterized membrane protein YphA (DoxX/SURF4 family)
MKKLNTPIRIFVGLLFIFSGLIKANDPHGLSYKMQEFFEVWGFDFLNPLSLISSLGMNVLEVFAGIAIIVNWQTKKITWLLFVLILFFTYLTGYALFSGKIKTCGCFGDCLPLTPAMSFTKDIILGILIIILLGTNTGKASKGIFGKIVLYTVTLGTAAFQWYALTYLPVVDCLPFKKGNDIVEQMKVPVGAIPDSTSIEFIYTKNGKEVRFDQLNFPADFDSTYVYVDREDKVVKKGNGLAAKIVDFNLTTKSGTDTTSALFANQKPYVLVFAKEMNGAESWKNEFQTIYKKLQAQNIDVILVTPEAERAASLFGNINIVTADATVIKTAARVIPTYFLMQHAVIKEKVAAPSIDKLFTSINNK